MVKSRNLTATRGVNYEKVIKKQKAGAHNQRKMRRRQKRKQKINRRRNVWLIGTETARQIREEGNKMAPQ